MSAATKPEGLRFGPLPPERCAHLCVDMQNVFADEDSEWHTPWMARVLPVVERVARAHAARTVFTRFLTPRRPEDAPGAWRRYYERWPQMTAGRIAPRRLELVPSLAALAPPAAVVDKATYSPWSAPALERTLRGWEIDTLVISGAETDVCVLAAVLGAVDRGYRVVVPTDALCSASDRTHDALMTLYRERFSQQIETAEADAILAAWR
jgi:nicotinamidase-related amidase